MPTSPPTPWIATTSSESSWPRRYPSRIASRQTTPATSPVGSAPKVSTGPQAGVIPTGPATAAEAAPRLVGRPSRRCSNARRASTAAADAVIVVTNAVPATAPRHQHGPRR
jgi:hypothetical protein